jgi:DNA polymerase
VFEPDARREALKEVFHQAKGCPRCPQLVATRTQVVFGAGNANADLMFVGEAPGASEDQLGLPFVGQAGKLLDRLLAEVGLVRGDVFIANVLKCRPPGNRNPLPEEIANCQEWLFRQLELIQPRVVCTLGNFATKLLRGDPTGITRLHGRDEVRVIGPRAVRLLPLFHPAAALYQASNVELLREDFRRIPALLAMEVPAQPPEPGPAGPAVSVAVTPGAAASPAVVAPPAWGEDGDPGPMPPSEGEPGWEEDPAFAGAGQELVAAGPEPVVAEPGQVAAERAEAAAAAPSLPDVAREEEARAPALDEPRAPEPPPAGQLGLF